MTKTKAADRLVWITLPNGKTTQVRAYSTATTTTTTTNQVARAPRPLALTPITRTLRDCGFTR